MNAPQTIQRPAGRYRVTIQSTDWFEVDLFASNAEEALDLAETIDGGLVHRRVDGEWKAVSAEEVGAGDFDPVNAGDEIYING